MKTMVKGLGIAAFAAMLVFVLAACKEPETNFPPDTPTTPTKPDAPTTPAVPSNSDSVINISAIQGITVPSNGGVPVTSITESAQYRGTVTWSPTVNGTFAASIVYTATITLTPKTGYTLQGVAANFFTVTGATTVRNAANSGVITAVFPATGATSTTSVSIIIIAPWKGVTPSTTVSGSAESRWNFTADAVSWSPSDNPFLGGVTYTASVTLTANSGYTFAGLSSATINGQSAEVSNNTGSTVTLSYTFPATDTKTVTSIAIKTQPTKLTYTHWDTLDLAGLTVTLTHDDTTTEDVYAENFTAKNITASPSQGNTLIHSEHNGRPVTIYGHDMCYTSNLTVNKATPTVADFNISGTGSSYYDGNPKPVTINPNKGINGKITVNYNGSTTAPSAIGEYTVTFDVAEGTNFNAVSEIFAGTLKINPFTSIAELKTYLQGKSDNTKTTTYKIKLNVSDLGDIRDALRIRVYIDLDLSDSTITTIPDYAFGGGSNSIYTLTGITIPNSVTSIGQGAFYCCTSLTSVTIPNSVTSIGDSAFGYTGLTSVTIPNSVTSIGDYAFASCTSLTSVTIPDSVTSIGDYAFASCTSLTSVTIPNSVTSIGGGAFSGCTGLTAINVDSDNTAYSSTNGILYNKNKTSLIICPKQKTGALTIPNSVTSIEWAAFSGCTGLTSITIPNSVTSIGGGAFSGCTSLASITIPNSVTSSIGDSAFYGCTSLTSVTFSNTSKVSSIGSYAFYGCTGLTGVLTIPNSVTSIGDYAFSGCTSLSVTIPNSVYNIGNQAFYDCNNITWYYNPEVRFAPSYPTLTVIIPNSVTFIKEGAFSNRTNLTSVTIPNSVTGIGDSAFYGCSGLTSITIPDSVTRIWDSAFYGCTSLTNVTIPNSVYQIGNKAFYGCTSLTNVTIPDNVTPLIGGNLIGHEVFRDCTSLTSITIPSSVTFIGSYAFYGCTSLTSVTLFPTKGNFFDYSNSFYGDLRTKFFASNSTNGTPGTYKTTAPVGDNSVWTKQ